MSPVRGIFAATIILLLMGAALHGALDEGNRLPVSRSPAPSLPELSPAVSPNTTATGTGQIRFVTDPNTGNQYVANEVIVRYNSGQFRNPAELDAYAAAASTGIGAQVVHDFAGTPLNGLQLLQLPASFSVPEAITVYNKDPAVLYAEPNYRIIAAVTGTGIQPAGSPPPRSGAPVSPDDPEFPRQYYLKNTGQTVLNVTGTPGADINATTAWGITRGSGSVIVAIMDTGIDYTDPELAGNMWVNPATGGHGGNFSSGAADENVPDSSGHGTAMAAILGAVSNNHAGTAGVAWNVRLMAIKVFTTDSGGATTMIDAVRAIRFADDKGASVTSISWVSGAKSRALEDALRVSPQLFVVAAGNTGTDNDVTPCYPAAYRLPNLISVAATDQNDRLAPFSNYGPVSVDLAAPGVNIPVYGCANPGSADPLCRYYVMDGTSAAVPQVAGVAVLVKSVNPRLTNIQVREILRSSVAVLPTLSGRVSTGGRLDAYTAVRTAQARAGTETTGSYRNEWGRDHGPDGKQGWGSPPDITGSPFDHPVIFY
jgi:thermitase